jgi:hypothetical protein
MTTFEEQINLCKDLIATGIENEENYKNNIPFTTAKIYLDGGKDNSYECFCYHYMGITIKIENHFNDEEICGICLNKWNLRNNDVIKLSCNHYFHKECILNWFSNDISNSCPICRCPHDSCFTAERELGLNTIINETNIINVKSKSEKINIDNSQNAIIAIVTHILPFSVDSIQTYTISSLLAKDFTVCSVISEHLYEKLKTLDTSKLITVERDEPTFYVTTDNDVFMSDKNVTLPISFPYIFYKNSFTTGTSWIRKNGKTPRVLIKFKIINFIQEDLLLISKYDLSSNCIEPVKKDYGYYKDSSGNDILEQPKSGREYSFSLMKTENYVKEDYLIPFGYIQITNVEIEMLGLKKNPSFYY